MGLENTVSGSIIGLEMACFQWMQQLLSKSAKTLVARNHDRGLTTLVHPSAVPENSLSLLPFPQPWHGYAEI